MPDFLQPEGQTEVPAQPAASADISPQTSPYDLRINATPDLPASPGVSGATPEFHADAPVLPAGIRRVPSTQDFSGKPTIGSEASSTVENGRAHWQDRADPAGSGVDFIKPRSQAGDQLAIQLPYEKPPIHLLRKDTDAAAQCQYACHPGLGKLTYIGQLRHRATVIRVTTGPTITRLS